MSTDPLVRRWQEALAASKPADQDKVLLTTCYAASACQRDLGCPFRNRCSRWEADMYRELAGPGWAQLAVAPDD